MYNITKGNVVPMKATLVHDEERFPVGASTGLSVRIYGHYRYIDAVNVTVDQEEDGVLYFDVPATLNYGVYGVEVKGKVNGTPWRTATDCVVKITPSTERNDGSEAVPEGDTYDIVMRVQIYKQQSSDRAIEEHNNDEASHPYILGELERIEGEIPTLPEHIVTDANYVHTDNNYTDTDKSKLNSALPNTTKYGSTIDLSMNSTTYVLTLSLKDQYGTVLNTKTVDLSDYYTKGQTDNAITTALNTALADYTTKAALTLLLADKQDVINDLATIRNGAAAGATAYQKPQGGIPSTDMSQAVQTSLGKADSSLQPTQQTLTDAQKQQARNNIGAAGVDDVPTLPDNVSYFSNDNGDGIVPTDGIKGEDIVASSAISVNPDVVTAITGEIGSATIITLVVPNDNLRHVWDMFFTTASDGGATIVVPQGATLHVPFGYSIASGKTYEVRIIGVGNDYYLTCQEYN